MDNTKYLNIIIINGVTGNVVEAEVPVDVSMHDLLPALAVELRIENSKNWRLMNETQDFDYDEDDSLISKGTKENDHCLLIYDTVSNETVGRRTKKNKKEQKEQECDLPIGTRGVGPVDIDEIKGAALIFLVHRYKILDNKCKKQKLKLRNHDSNRHSRVNSAIYFIISQIVTGFGINLITQNVKEGWVVFSAGVVIMCGGFFYSFWPIQKRK